MKFKVFLLVSSVDETFLMYLTFSMENINENYYNRKHLNISISFGHYVCHNGCLRCYFMS